MPPIPALDYILPILGAVAAGFLIGFEREYRGRPAGLRTHLLVSLTSALLMLAAVHQVRWLTDTPHDIIRIDPVRMAHGILTGIGFLCGGVIFRHGLSVHGVTTAASLWLTSALGVLFGVGFYGLAIGGTIAALAVLVFLRGVEGRLPRLHLFDAKVRYRAAEAASPEEFQTLVRSLGFSPSPLGQSLLAGGEILEISTTLHGARAACGPELAERLRADARVVEFDLTPRND